MGRKFAAFVLVSLARYLYNSKKYGCECEVLCHTIQDMLLSGWMIYLIAG